MALDIISTDVDNVRATWRWLAANMTPQPEILEGILQATESLYLYYENRGQILEGMEMLDLAITAADALPASFLQQRTLAKLLSRQAILAFRANQFTLCSDLFHRSDPLLRELLAKNDLSTATKNDIEHDIAFSSVYYSYIVARTQTLDATKELLREAIVMCEANGNQWVLARALNALGNTERVFEAKKRLYLESIRIARELGDEIYLALAAVNLINWVSLPHEVRPLLEEVIEIYQRMESQSGMALGYSLLSNSAFRAGDYLQAKTYSQKSLTIYKELGFIYYYIPNIQNLANTCWALGALDEAEEHMQHALRLVKESGDLENTIKTSNALSLFYLENGELEKARDHYKMGLSLLPEIQSARQKSEALDSLGNLAIDLGEYGQARKHFEAHIPAAENANDTTGAAWAKKNLGTIALELGDYETAAAYFQESLECHRQEGHSWAIMELLDCMGRVAYALGDNVAATAHYREALALQQNFWTILNQLEIAVDWSGLLMKMGERERPFTYLTILSRHPMFVPPVVHRRVRQKAARLLAELEATVSKQTVAQIKLNTRGQRIEDVVNGLLAPEVTALEMMAT
jgi:tetratricopeptide (TPR) repeat protein